MGDDYDYDNLDFDLSLDTDDVLGSLASSGPNMTTQRSSRSSAGQTPRRSVSKSTSGSSYATGSSGTHAPSRSGPPSYTSVRSQPPTYSRATGHTQGQTLAPVSKASVRETLASPNLVSTSATAPRPSGVVGTELLNVSLANSVAETVRNESLKDTALVAPVPVATYEDGTYHILRPHAQDRAFIPQINLGGGLPVYPGALVPGELEERVVPVPPGAIRALACVLLDHGESAESLDTLGPEDMERYGRAIESLKDNKSERATLVEACALLVQKPHRHGYFQPVPFEVTSVDDEGKDVVRSSTLMTTSFELSNDGCAFYNSTQAQMAQISDTSAFANSGSARDGATRQEQAMAHFASVYKPVLHTTLLANPSYSSGIGPTLFDMVVDAYKNQRDFIHYSVSFDRVAESFGLNPRDPRDLHHRNVELVQAVLEDYQINHYPASILGKLHLSLAVNDSRSRVLELIRQPFRREATLLGRTIKDRKGSVLHMPTRVERCFVPDDMGSNIKKAEFRDEKTGKLEYGTSRILYDRPKTEVHEVLSTLLPLDVETDLHKLFAADPDDASNVYIPLPSRQARTYLQYVVIAMLHDLISVAAPQSVLDRARAKYPSAYARTVHPFLSNNGSELERKHLQRVHDLLDRYDAAHKKLADDLLLVEEAERETVSRTRRKQLLKEHEQLLAEFEKSVDEENALLLQADLLQEADAKEDDPSDESDAEDRTPGASRSAARREAEVIDDVHELADKIDQEEATAEDNKRSKELARSRSLHPSRATQGKSAHHQDKLDTLDQSDSDSESVSGSEAADPEQGKDKAQSDSGSGSESEDDPNGKKSGSDRDRKSSSDRDRKSGSDREDRDGTKTGSDREDGAKTGSDRENRVSDAEKRDGNGSASESEAKRDPVGSDVERDQGSASESEANRTEVDANRSDADANRSGGDANRTDAEANRGGAEDKAKDDQGSGSESSSSESEANRSAVEDKAADKDDRGSASESDANRSERDAAREEAKEEAREEREAKEAEDDAGLTDIEAELESRGDKLVEERYEALRKLRDQRHTASFAPDWNQQNDDLRRFLVNATVVRPNRSTSSRSAARFPVLDPVSRHKVTVAVHLNKVRAYQYLRSILQPFDYSNVMHRLDTLSLIIRPQQSIYMLMVMLNNIPKENRGNLEYYHLFHGTFDLHAKIRFDFKTLEYHHGRSGTTV